MTDEQIREAFFAWQRARNPRDYPAEWSAFEAGYALALASRPQSALSDEDMATLIYQHTGMSAVQNGREYVEVLDLCRALLSHSAGQAVPEVKYGCHCDLEPGMKPDGCVIDSGERNLCVYARRHQTKEQCEYWQPVKAPAPSKEEGK